MGKVAVTTQRCRARGVVLATRYIQFLTRRLKVAMSLGEERFICKCAIAMKLDSCTTERSVTQPLWLSSSYLFSLMRAILFRADATTASDASTGILEESVDHESALTSKGSNLLLSSCIFS